MEPWVIWCVLCGTTSDMMLHTGMVCEVDCPNCGHRLNIHWNNNRDEDTGHTWTSVEVTPVR